MARPEASVVGLAAGVAAILVIIDWLRGNRSFIRESPDQP